MVGLRRDSVWSVALFAAKEKRRRYLALRPYPEKVQMLLQLQRMAVPLLRGRDPRARVWQISTRDSPTSD